MSDTVIQFFDLIGLSMEVPQTFPELLQWLVYLFVALMLVLAVFRVVGSILSGFLTVGRS